MVEHLQINYPNQASAAVASMRRYYEDWTVVQKDEMEVWDRIFKNYDGQPLPIEQSDAPNGEDIIYVFEDGSKAVWINLDRMHSVVL